jgi:DNA/RNA-binding domain of Phe-tRNA-synthetase-like protein
MIGPAKRRASAQQPSGTAGSGGSEPVSGASHAHAHARAERPDVQLGWCAREIEHELPRLRLMFSRARLARVGIVMRRSPPTLERRLNELSNRFKGAQAVGVRREPVPSAYRIFYRQIGLDPEVARTPIEAAVLERMLRGGFLAGSLLEDVLLIALVDTGVPVWALDAEAVDGALGVRVSSEGEPLGRSSAAWALPAGRLVVADGSAAVGLLFGELAADCEPGTRTREVVLFAVQVSGVPTLYVEEALWICRNGLERAR